MNKKWIGPLLVLMIVIFSGCQSIEDKKVDTIVEKEAEGTETEEVSEVKNIEEAETADKDIDVEAEAADKNESNQDDQNKDEQTASEPEKYEVFQDEETGKYGYKTETEVLDEHLFDEANEFVDGFAVVNRGDMTYVIDKEFNEILESDTGIENFGYGYFGMIQEINYFDPSFNKYRLVDSTGKELLNSDVFEVDVYNKDLILVADHLKGWLIDGDGRPVGSKSSNAFVGYSRAEVVDGNFLLYRNEDDEDYYKKVDAYGVIIDERDLSDHSVVLGDGISVSDYIPFFGRFEKIYLPKLSSDTNTFDTANAYFGAIYNVEAYKTSDVSSIYGTKETDYSAQRVGDIIQVDINYYEYGFGAAHPFSYAETYLLSANTGNPYRLSDMLASDDGYERISQLVRDKISSTELAQAIYVELSEVKVEINTQFYVSTEGITFYYAPYEIAPYAGGMPEIFLTWDELEGTIDKDSIFYLEIMK